MRKELSPPRHTDSNLRAVKPQDTVSYGCEVTSIAFHQEFHPHVSQVKSEVLRATRTFSMSELGIARVRSFHGSLGRSRLGGVHRTP